MSNKFVVNGGLSIPSGKTLEIGSLSLSGIYQGVSLSDDEANKKVIPSEYSVKKYVDAQLSSTDMNFAADSNTGALAGDDLKVDLSGGETFSILGTTNEIETDTAVANQIKVGLPSAVTITTSAAIGGLSVSAGSITDVTGEIDFSNENLSTTGTLAAGATTVTGAMSASGTVTGSSIVVGDADMSEADLEKLDGITDGTAAANKALVLDASSNIASIGTIGSGAISSSGTVTATGSFIIGSADMSEADLEKLDGITDGTAAASKALVVDANKDIGTIRNITIDGTFSDGNYTFDTDGNVSGLGTIGSGAITSTGASSMVTLTVSTSANLANGSTMASSTAPTVDAGIANKKYVDDQVTGADLDVKVGETSYDLDLTTEKLAFAGTANEITVAFSEANPGAVGNEGLLTVSLPDDVTIGDALTVTGASNMNGAVTLGDATSDDITFTGRAASSIAPKTDDTYDLGTSDLHWNVTYSNEVRGDADEMIISADGDETSVSGSAANSLSLNASGGIFTDDAVDMDSTLNVADVATFQAKSVMSAGLTTGGEIISDTDSTDSLGSSSVRWLNVHTDEVALEYSARKDFSVATAGVATTVLTFLDASYETAKVVSKIKNGGNVTSQEALVVSSNGTCAIVEYAKVSIGTEVAMTWAATSDGTTTTVTCNATGDLKGSYDLIA